MYSVFNSISGRSLPADMHSNKICRVTKLALAILVTLGIGAAAFSAIFFTSYLLVPSLIASVTLIVVLGGVDMCILICCKKKKRELSQINFLGDLPPYPGLEIRNSIVKDSSLISQVEELGGSKEEKKSEEIQQYQAKDEHTLSIEKVKNQISSTLALENLKHPVFFNKNLLSEVFKFFDVKEICRLSAVCKEWNEIIHRKDFILWQRFAQQEKYEFLPSHIMSIGKQVFTVNGMKNKTDALPFNDDESIIHLQNLINAKKIFVKNDMTIEHRLKRRIEKNLFVRYQKDSQQLQVINLVTKNIDYQINLKINDSYLRFKMEYHWYQIFNNYIAVHYQTLNNQCKVKIWDFINGKSYDLVINKRYISFPNLYVYNDECFYIDDNSKDCIHSYNLQTNIHTKTKLAIDQIHIINFFDDRMIYKIWNDNGFAKLYIFNLQSKKIELLHDSILLKTPHHPRSEYILCFNEQFRVLFHKENHDSDENFISCENLSCSTSFQIKIKNLYPTEAILFKHFLILGSFFQSDEHKDDLMLIDLNAKMDQSQKKSSRKVFD